MVPPFLKNVSPATSPSTDTLMLIPRVSRSRAVLRLDTNADRGRDGEEVQDYDYTFNNARRRSNSSTQALGDFKTKFEAMDTDPVFEEELHGPTEEDIEKASTHDSTDSSTLGGSVDDDDKKM
ncbi:hypothetical protein A1O7_05783 [Cladophialophora yegresii CBS 114405]|uniref:Uncharacterized protein n=1 Tax=Cladophialophora yegresii CBS 114405 TaxID=1182544 RepID=W9VS48_9EURO|nr:uncharacterized protein A1O7_05783 [Cladophialophora yegresii CBS 114405]EXJ58358.1 hypothetical protein A1O7_05783 [Cladophialophora yegresii CBS 114405]